MTQSPWRPRGGAAALLFALLAVGAAATGAAAADEAAPFRTLNTSPTVAIFGLPAWDTPVAQGSRIEITGQIGNDYRFSQRGGDEIALDGETSRTSFVFDRALGGGWSAGVEIPYFRISGGVLDDVIDAWHSAFGMPDGGRNERAQDQLLVLLGDPSGDFLRIEHNESGLGDIQLGGGRAFGSEEARFFLRAAVKLPTGDADILAGSGATDWALTLLRSRHLELRRRQAGFFWGLGVAELGEAKRVRYPQESSSYLGMVGGSAKLFPRMGLKVQIDAHSRLYDSALKELGEMAVQISIGGWRDLGPRRSFEFAIGEDLSVGTAPDVALYVALRWPL